MENGFQYRIEDGLGSMSGYEYHTNLDVQDDCIKIYHRCFKNGSEVRMPIEFYSMSSYDYIEPVTFRGFILKMKMDENRV